MKKFLCFILIIAILAISGCNKENKVSSGTDNNAQNGVQSSDNNAQNGAQSSDNNAQSGAQTTNKYPANIPLDTSFSSSEAKTVCRTIAEEGTVLLKNEDNTLPLKASDNIAIFGSRQLWEKTYSTYGYYLGGAGSGAMYGSPDMEPYEALEKKSAEGKFKFYKGITDKYIANPRGYIPTSGDIKAAKSAGVNKVIYIISRLSGESGTEEEFLKLESIPDEAIKKGQWFLSEDEEKMLKTLNNNFDKVIVVLNIGSLMDTEWIVNGIDGEQVADSVLISWYGGLEGPEALANVLSGDSNPSGKLTATAADINAYPSTKDFYNKEYTNYTEDIFVGYRYFETLSSAYDKVNFEFGFGLSYTTFSVTNQNVSAEKDKITVTATVTNTGKVSGKEVLQVYFSAPQMGQGGAKLSKPAKELAGFAKTSLLAPGKSERVSITFSIDDMSSYDDTGKTGAKSAYVLEKGEYKIYVGVSIRNTVLAGAYKVDKFKITQQLTENAASNALEKRLLADGSYETLKTGKADVVSQEKYINDEKKDAPVVYESGVVTYDDVLSGKNTLDDLVAQMTIKELIAFNARIVANGSAQKSGVGATEEINKKFGLPVGNAFDNPAGITSATSAGMFGFPSETMLACTWNVSLAADMGAVNGKYAKMNKKCQYWLAPSLNIQRNPLAGRNFEQFSEDPLISGIFGSAIVKNAEYFGVACAIKHFACNNKETNRTNNDSRVSERALREIYLKGFEMVVKDVNPNSIMTSYNKVNGIWCSENSELLMDIVRGEWGFQGMIMTDWGGYHDNVAGLLAGMNIRMGGSANKDYRGFTDAYNEGLISRKLLEINAKYIINSLMKVKIK